MITLRPPEPGDRDALIALRDEQFHRFMGAGSPDPQPTFCITVDGNVVGWVDYDEGQREWLNEGQVNMGYALHPDHRGRGYATRALMLLLHHLAQATDVEVATLLVSPQNRWSLGIAQRCGFRRQPDLNGEAFFTKSIPPLTYTDGIVTIRPFRMDDLDRDIEAKDDVQIDWLWLEGQRESWEAMSPEEQRDHARRGIEAHEADHRNGPKWSFVIDVDGRYCGHVDCDLANPGVPQGEANVSYSAHPDARGNGYVSRAVRLILRFIADHTGAREAWIGVHPDNEASLRVAHAVGAVERDRTDVIRHVLPITR